MDEGDALFDQGRIIITSLSFVLLPMGAMAAIAGPADALSTHLQKADDSYHAGEVATTIGEKELNFLRALRLYSQLEGEPGNGKLYYNIGNTYFQLEQYGWAILYYLRAERLRPRDDRIQFHLTLARAQQGLPLAPENKLKNALFFWHVKLSQTERIQLFIALIALLFFFGSLWLWYRSQAFKILSIMAGLCSALLLSSILYFYYFAPVDAVIVKAFGLYHGPREDYALVSDEPFIPGTEVKVEKVVDNGTWLKIITPEGKVGYVPSDVIRII
jgi:tetratricopeptide (TPR) repeat protein